MQEDQLFCQWRVRRSQTLCLFPARMHQWVEIAFSYSEQCLPSGFELSQSLPTQYWSLWSMQIGSVGVECRTLHSIPMCTTLSSYAGTCVGGENIIYSANKRHHRPEIAHGCQGDLRCTVYETRWSVFIAITDCYGTSGHSMVCSGTSTPTLNAHSDTYKLHVCILAYIVRSPAASPSLWAEWIVNLAVDVYSHEYLAMMNS